MWNPHGVDEGDQLDAGEARWVLRRAARMLRPYRGRVVLAIGMAVLWTFSILAGPFFVRYGIDNGITKNDAGALNRAVIAYAAVAVASYFIFRVQVMAISWVGEGFLRDLRVRVFDHLQRLSMPFYDREKSGVLVSRMTSDIDALAELVQMGLLMFIMNSLRFRTSPPIASWPVVSRSTCR
jgi:ATP-binding cassette subfamily B protein